MRVSMKNGIEIGPMKISLLQLLIAASVVGGFGVTLTASTEAIKKLDETMTEVNNTLTAMKIENAHDRGEIDQLKKNDAQQNEDIIELQIVTGIRK